MMKAGRELLHVGEADEKREHSHIVLMAAGGTGRDFDEGNF